MSTKCKIQKKFLLLHKKFIQFSIYMLYLSSFMFVLAFIIAFYLLKVLKLKLLNLISHLRSIDTILIIYFIIIFLALLGFFVEGFIGYLECFYVFVLFLINYIILKHFIL